MTGVPGRVGVIGGGRMGIGIAHAFLLAGARVTIVEQHEDAAAGAQTALLSATASSVERGSTTESVDTMSERITVSADTSALAGMDLVVEAVPESLPLKQSMLARAQRAAPDAWIATNTSSLSIDRIADALDRPDRLIGLHFFNPVPSSALVEIVRGPRSASAVVAAAAGWVEAFGKTPITVRDSPGFASSRLGVVIALEAIRMLEEDVASAADIDAAMVLGYKFPVGPLRLTDLVGLDVRLGIAEYLEGAIGGHFRPPDLLRAMVAEGKLGRKSGEGFFTWP